MSRFGRVVSCLLKIYRVGKPERDNAFWTPDAEYASYVHESGPMYSGTLEIDTDVLRVEGQATRGLISQAKRAGFNAVIFPSWDWPTDEIVVLKRAAVRGVRLVEEA